MRFFLGLPTYVQLAATCIARKVNELSTLPHRSPITIAAAAIYMASQASDNKKTLKEISDVAGVMKWTILKSYKLIYPRAAELFPLDQASRFEIKQLPQP